MADPKKGWYKEGDVYVLYDNNGVYVKSQTQNPKTSAKVPVTTSASSGPPVVDPIYRPEIFKNLPKGKQLKNRADILDASGNIIPTALDVPWRQHNKPGTANVFGRDAYDVNEFKTRHPDYFKGKTSWDPEKEADVKDFQNWYNKSLTDMGLPEYFDDTRGFKVDGLWGEHTYSTPGFEDVVEQPAIIEQAKAAVTTPGNPIAPQYKADTEAPWYLQDKLAVGNAASNLFGIKRYMPWQATPDTQYIDPTFYDPTGELAANAEMANIGVTGAQTFTGPQTFNAQVSGIMGNAAGKVADTLGRYNNLNVGVANQTEAQNTGIYNTASREKAHDSTQLFDKYTIANQQFDNARRDAKTKLVDSTIQGITNASMTQNLNSLYENYQIDPRSGGNLNWLPGGYNRFKAIPPEQEMSGANAFVEQWMNKYPGSDPAKLLEVYQKMNGKV